MRKHVPAVIVVALATLVVAGLWQPISADAKRVRAFVYPDRSRPETSVVVEDFRVNETVWDYGGVHYLWVHGRAGSFKVALADVHQIEVVKFVGLTQMDWARYDVKVTCKDPSVVHTGTMDVRVLRGEAEGHEWYYYPATLKDRGTMFWRIVIGEQTAEPTLAAELPAPVIQPVTMPAAPAPAPAGESEDDIFARMSLDELNARNPLADVFFDFDKADLRPDAEDSMRRNVAWMQRWPTVAIRIGGYADPRGTQEYNLELGQRRAEVAQRLLISMGIPASRISNVSRGESQAFCAESTEACWARNRRAHFVVTAK